MGQPAQESANQSAERQHLSGDQTAEQVKDILVRARKLIENEENWFAGCDDGTSPDRKGEHQRCSEIARYAAIEGLPDPDWGNLDRASNRVLSEHMDWNIIVFNATHTHAEVLQAWDRAIAACSLVDHQSAVEASAAVSERSERIVP